MDAEGFDLPFRHWLVTGLVPADLLAAAVAVEPTDGCCPWVRYANDLEQKRTCRDLEAMPRPWAALLRHLNSVDCLARLRALTGLPGLVADPSLHGAGIHVTDPGGWLNPHLDYAMHPSGLERRLNLIVFLNREWREEWGGAFELYGPDCLEPIKRVYPWPGGAVVWEAGDLAYHGAQRTAPDAPPRLTAAVYHLAPPRPGCTRVRALFAPRR